MLKTLQSVWRGDSLFRHLMHQEIREIEITGSVADLGAGHKKSYAHQMPQKGLIYLKTVDQKETADVPGVNFEKDSLPFSDNSLDTVLMFNLLEHIFNYCLIVNESKRVLKSGGKIVGFVPFFCPYHPGPRDFFRYTNEALEKIFINAGFEKDKISIVPLGFGPCSAAFHLVFLSFSKIWRKRLRVFLILALIDTLIFDKIISKLQDNQTFKFPLGYKFIVKK